MVESKEKTKKKFVVLKRICFSFAILILVVTISFFVFIVPWSYESVPVKTDENTRIISYNIKYAEDWLESFEYRKDVILEQLYSYNADIISLQEANYGWMNNDDGLPVLLEEYAYVGVGREDGDTQGEYAPIFYLEDKYNVLESDTLWLSQTPNEVSIGWDASTYRIMTYVTFEDVESKEIFTVYNTHLDHIGEDARKNSVDLIINTINENENPYIITGDMNFPSFDNLYNEFTSVVDDTKKIAQSSMNYGTINYNFSYNMFHFITIDYIFASKNDFEIINYRVDPTYKFEDKPVSDHFPVIVDFKINVM